MAQAEKTAEKTGAIVETPDQVPAETTRGSSKVAPSQRPGLYYRFLRGTVRLLLRLFYRTIEVTGLDNLDPRYPTILAANHPNSIIDPLMVGILEERAVRFVARDGLFRIPGFGTLLRSVGAVPIYRPSDHADKPIDNTKMFSACRDVLQERGVLAVFPEGKTHGQYKINELRTGVARMALDAERNNDYSLGVRVQPVVMNFLVRQAFRSDVHVAFGTPITVDAEIAEVDQEDDRAAVRTLTDRLQDELRKLAIHIEGADDERVIAQVTTIIAEIRADEGLDAEQSPAERTALVQRIVDAYRWYSDVEPERVADLRRRVNWFVQERQRLGLGGEIPAFQHRNEALRHRWAHAKLRHRLLYGALGFPLALFGFVVSIVPYILLRGVLSVVKLTPERVALGKAMIGMVLFGAAFAAQTYYVWMHYGNVAASIYGAALIPSALFSLRYFTEARLHRVSIKGFFQGWRRGRLALLRAERLRLEQDLKLMRSRYLRYLSKSGRGRLADAGVDPRTDSGSPLDEEEG